MLCAAQRMKRSSSDYLQIRWTSRTGGCLHASPPQGCGAMLIENALLSNASRTRHTPETESFKPFAHLKGVVPNMSS
jgi:hypothetical protein